MKSYRLELTDFCSSCGGKACKSEPLQLSTQRVRNYTPDNVFARLSLGGSSDSGDTQAREARLAAEVNRLLAIIEPERSNDQSEGGPSCASKQ